MKKPMVAAVLGFLLGPFGLFYVSASLAITALLCIVGLSIVTGGLAALPTWVSCGVAGWVGAKSANKAAASAATPVSQLATPAVAEARPAGKFCSTCGQSLVSTARFCNKCGAAA